MGHLRTHALPLPRLHCQHLLDGHGDHRPLPAAEVPAAEVEGDHEGDERAAAVPFAV